MGRPKVKIIDDSLPAKKGTTDSLVESLKAELGIVEEAPKKEEVRIKNLESSEQEEKKTKPKKAPQKEGKVKYRSKKYLEAVKDLDKSKKLPLNEAVILVQKSSYTKFPGTVEIHINTNQKNIRGLINLPFATGKKLKVLVFPSGALRTSDLKDLEDTGVIIGTDETISEIEKGLPAGRQGNIDFDVLVTTPEWMPKLAKVAKVLGPRGLMPNPKNGTITEDLKRVVSELQAGKLEYKTESNGQVIHLAIGKVTQPSDEIAANVKTLFSTVGKTKITKITLSPTMGPGIKVDLASI